MNIHFLILLLFFVNAAQAKPFIFAGYGLGSVTDSAKDQLDLSLKGTPLKLALGNRFGHLEFEVFFRNFSADGVFIHDGQKNSLIRKENGIGIGMGVYLIPPLRLSFGYAAYQIKEDLDNGVTADQEADIVEKYGVTDEILTGPYAGLDFHLFTMKNIKLMITTTAYLTTSGGGKSFEVLAAFKIPFGGGGRSSSFNPLRSMSDR